MGMKFTVRSDAFNQAMEKINKLVPPSTDMPEFRQMANSLALITELGFLYVYAFNGITWGVICTPVNDVIEGSVVVSRDLVHIAKLFGWQLKFTLNGNKLEMDTGSGIEKFSVQDLDPQEMTGGELPQSLLVRPFPCEDTRKIIYAAIKPRNDYESLYFNNGNIISMWPSRHFAISRSRHQDESDDRSFQVRASLITEIIEHEDVTFAVTETAVFFYGEDWTVKIPLTDGRPLPGMVTDSVVNAEILQGPFQLDAEDLSRTVQIARIRAEDARLLFIGRGDRLYYMLTTETGDSIGYIKATGDVNGVIFKAIATDIQQVISMCTNPAFHYAEWLGGNDENYKATILVRDNNEYHMVGPFVITDREVDELNELIDEDRTTEGSATNLD